MNPKPKKFGELNDSDCNPVKKLFRGVKDDIKHVYQYRKEYREYRKTGKYKKKPTSWGDYRKRKLDENGMSDDWISSSTKKKKKKKRKWQSAERTWEEIKQKFSQSERNFQFFFLTFHENSRRK